MFCILGLNKKQVQHLQSTYRESRFRSMINTNLDQHHVYMAGNSRISVAGLNTGNVEYFAQALDETVRAVI